MSNLRFQVVEAAFSKRPLEVSQPKERPSAYFGKYVFNQEKMFKYLPLDTYKKLREVIENGTALDLQVANEVAQGMKQWAIDMGVTHCTHWFQPLTEGTAEKHDSFVNTTERAVSSRNSQANNSSSRSPTPRRSPTAASARLSKHADTQHGTRRHRCSSSETH